MLVDHCLMVEPSPERLTPGLQLEDRSEPCHLTWQFRSDDRSFSSKRHQKHVVLHLQQTSEPRCPPPGRDGTNVINTLVVGPSHGKDIGTTVFSTWQMHQNHVVLDLKRWNKRQKWAGNWSSTWKRHRYHVVLHPKETSEPRYPPHIRDGTKVRNTLEVGPPHKKHWYHVVLHLAETSEPCYPPSGRDSRTMLSSTLQRHQTHIILKDDDHNERHDFIQ